MKDRTEVVKVKKGISDEAKEFIAISSMLVGFLSVIGVPITCAIVASSKAEFKYSKNENGEYIATGTIEYDRLNQCYFVQIENDSTKTNEFYICKKTINGRITDYINILNNKNVFSTNSKTDSQEENNNRKIVNDISVSDYLYGYNGVKAKYTPEDVENLIERIKDNIKEENKVLVKAKFNANDVTKVNL